MFQQQGEGTEGTEGLEPEEARGIPDGNFPKINREPEGFLFRDRADAGRQLAQKLMPYKNQHPIVLALPRGGVEVGHEVAKALGSPLDVLVVRKIGAPNNPEFGVGAIAEGGIRVFDQSSLAMLELSVDDLRETVGRETKELGRRVSKYRQGQPGPPKVAEKTVIVADDGLATGVTAQAAVEAVRSQKPARLILAVPVCSREAAETLAVMVDELVCLHMPEHFAAVGVWYEDFRQLSDDEVIELLRKVRGR